MSKRDNTRRLRLCHCAEVINDKVSKLEEIENVVAKLYK